MTPEELEEEQRRKEAQEQERARKARQSKHRKTDPNTRLLRNILWIEFLQFMRKK